MKLVIPLFLFVLHCAPFFASLTGWNHTDSCRTNVDYATLCRLKRFVLCCQFAYKLPQSPEFQRLFSTLTQDHGLISYEPFFHEKEKEYVAGYLLFFPDETVVAFRGTIVDGRVRSELWNNLNSRILPQTWGGVHRGIFKEYSLVRNDLFRLLRGIDNWQNRPLVFTGHSLGCMGQIAALELNLEKGILAPPMECVTFGAYKIFDDPYLFQNLGIPNTRVRFKNDFVASFPFTGNFHHVNTRDILFYHQRKFEHRIIYYKQFIERMLRNYI